jgi:uncharacterized protein YukE
MTNLGTEELNNPNEISMTRKDKEDYLEDLITELESMSEALETSGLDMFPEEYRELLTHMSDMQEEVGRVRKELNDADSNY